MTDASLINDWRWPVRLVVDSARVMAFPGAASTSPGSGSDPDSLSDSQTELHSVWSDENRPDIPATESLSKSNAWYQRIFFRATRESAASGQTAFQRIYRVFLGARLVLGLVLLASFVLAGIFVARPSVLISIITVGYAAQTLSAWLLYRPNQNWGVKGIGLARLRWRDWFSTIGVDIVCYWSLHFLLANTVFNLLPFLVLPVLMAGVLTPRLMALATAAAVALGLLMAAWLTSVSESQINPLMFAQAGLAGSGFFVITVLAGELAGRIARVERSARGSMELARQQAQLNRLMIEEIQDGVLVVDPRGHVRAANPAGRRLLSSTGMCGAPPFNLADMPACDRLLQGVMQAFSAGQWPEAGRDFEVNFGPLSKRLLRMKVRFTRQQAAHENEEFCVLLLEDVRNMQARTRQEKLAAMGRMSAGIAHEIRNPLAAISQANALLSEDAASPLQRQLTRMVSDNVERLKLIIDDVLDAAPAGPQRAEVIDVASVVLRTCREWAQAAGVSLESPSALQIDVPSEGCGASFDVDHLRRVLVNLLDNAWRHGTRLSGAVQVCLRSANGHQWELNVRSDGPAIATDVEPYLFEPFFSTRSRGTGLGLYICRELCERYGASIDYRLCLPDLPGGKERNEFFVLMPQQKLDALHASLSLPN